MLPGVSSLCHSSARCVSVTDDRFERLGFGVDMSFDMLPSILLKFKLYYQMDLNGLKGVL